MCGPRSCARAAARSASRRSACSHSPGLRSRATPAGRGCSASASSPTAWRGTAGTTATRATSPTGTRSAAWSPTSASACSPCCARTRGTGPRSVTWQRDEPAPRHRPRRPTPARRAPDAITGFAARWTVGHDGPAGDEPPPRRDDIVESNLDKIRAYYASFDEWGRLDSPEGARELTHALEILADKLPPGSRVLDLGGGPGRYAIELAKRGHRVVLADLSPALVEVARQRVAEAAVTLEAFDIVHAADLGRYADQSFDAILAFGPFYHLVAEAERRQATAEIRRVLAPHGQAFIA